MSVSSGFSSRFAVVALVAVLAPGLAGSPAGAAVPRSPLVVPVVSLQDVGPNNRSIAVSIVRGSVTTTDDYAVGVEAVHLPQNARVTALAAFAIDENGTDNLEVQLWRRRIGTGLLEGNLMAVAPTTGSSATMQEPRDTTVSDPAISNAAYVYWVSARIPADTELFGVQIEFQTPLFDDGFEAGNLAAWAPGGVEPGFTSPLTVNFADAISTTTGIDGCWYGGDTGSTAEAYVMGGNHDGAECCFVAPVHLPHGVTVTAIISYVLDTGASNVTLSLRRKNLANSVVTSALATTTSAGSGATVRLFSDGTISNGVIDNDSYSYFLSSDTCLDPAQTLFFYQTLIFFDE
jgi:hypothetical protein